MRGGDTYPRGKLSLFTNWEERLLLHQHHWQVIRFDCHALADATLFWRSTERRQIGNRDSWSRNAQNLLVQCTNEVKQSRVRFRFPFPSNTRVINATLFTGGEAVTVTTWRHFRPRTRRRESWDAQKNSFDASV